MFTLILLLAVVGLPRLSVLTSSGKRFLMKGLQGHKRKKEPESNLHKTQL